MCQGGELFEKDQKCERTAAAMISWIALLAWIVLHVRARGEEQLRKDGHRRAAVKAVGSRRCPGSRSSWGQKLPWESVSDIASPSSPRGSSACAGAPARPQCTQSPRSASLGARRRMQAATGPTPGTATSGGSGFWKPLHPPVTARRRPPLMGAATGHSHDSRLSEPKTTKRP